MPKVSPEVTARVESGSKRIPVIVTLARGADPALLEPTGMTITRAMESIPVVAGTVAAGDVADLAELGAVERVEYDGEMHAL